jgi:metal-dependent amidase/aminoacylase/carboxypeptidase family protein
VAGETRALPGVRPRGQVRAADAGTTRSGTGKGAHAARPWEGNDTVVTAAQTIMALQTIPSREVNIYKNDVTLSIGAIGGAVTFNVLPEAVTLDGALRYTDDSERTHLEGRILEVAQGVAASADRPGRSAGHDRGRAGG